MPPPSPELLEELVVFGGSEGLSVHATGEKAVARTRKETGIDSKRFSMDAEDIEESAAYQANNPTAALRAARLPLTDLPARSYSPRPSSPKSAFP